MWQPSVKLIYHKWLLKHNNCRCAVTEYHARCGWSKKCGKMGPWERAFISRCCQHSICRRHRWWSHSAMGGTCPAGRCVIRAAAGCHAVGLRGWGRSSDVHAAHMFIGHQSQRLPQRPTVYREQCILVGKQTCGVFGWLFNRIFFLVSSSHYVVTFIALLQPEASVNSVILQPFSMTSWVGQHQNSHDKHHQMSPLPSWKFVCVNCAKFLKHFRSSLSYIWHKTGLRDSKRVHVQ